MNPLHALLAAINTARLSEPVRLYVYGVAAVVISGFALFGGLTDQGAEFLLIAAGIVFGVSAPAAELARLGVYSPKYLAERGVLELPGPVRSVPLSAHAADTAVARAAGWHAAGGGTDTAFVHRIPPVGRVK